MPARRRHWLLRGFARFLGRALMLVLLLAALGFVWFLLSIPLEESSTRRADGIVALTGGAARVTDAIELLASGRGKRLLISGVHPATSAAEISRLKPDYARLVRCCVDLDRDALNTWGNATNTRRWVEQQGFRSIIVVTSNYHMPRAMMELSRQLPDVELLPYPVVSPTLRTEPWWASLATTRLVFSEYVKYILALVRMQAEPLLAPLLPAPSASDGEVRT
ncbi:MAG TPA: YdcF family protein [Xanthobacteraceae bacterium]|nr:YdcF family protein [Xanthobacteraceae bacterium]